MFLNIYCSNKITYLLIDKFMKRERQKVYIYAHLQEQKIKEIVWSALCPEEKELGSLSAGERADPTSANGFLHLK